MIDTSASLYRQHSKQKDFIKSVINGLQISPTGNHAGAVVFSKNAKLSIKFSDHSSSNAFNKAVDQLPLLGSTTRIDRALVTAYNGLFTMGNGMRADASRILILLTDGEQSKDIDSIPPYDAIVPFHEEGVHVIVIGIGSKINKDQLARIVKDKMNLYFAKDFDELKSQAFVHNITVASCKPLGTNRYLFYSFLFDTLR